MTKNFNDAYMDSFLQKLEDKKTPVSTIRGGMLGIVAVILVLAVAVTVIGIVLSLTVSPWFWIAVGVSGGYSVILGIGLATVSKATEILK